ncbi:MAG: hypothetical protein LWX52_11110 [Deltaproteobacteria bacterium]|nr:hypothetical protein [Deltaproteobacteria bacterium]
MTNRFNVLGLLPREESYSIYIRSSGLQLFHVSFNDVLAEKIGVGRRKSYGELNDLVQVVLFQERHIL